MQPDGPQPPPAAAPPAEPADTTPAAPADGTPPEPLGQTAEELAALAADPRAGVRREVAANPATPPDVLARLAEDGLAGVRREVASHPATPSSALARLAEDGNLWVRRDAAANPATPRAALDRLYRAGSAPGLAGPAPPDPTLDPAELAALAAGGEWARRLAARHPATPPAALARLAADPIPAIRAAAAAHAAVPTETLERLHDAVLEESGAIRRALLERLVLEAARDGRDVPLAAALVLAGDASSPASILVRLAEHGASVVRAAVAFHSGYGGRHRRLLCRAGSSEDLLGFAPPDPDLGAADLARLAHGGGWARLLAARHAATPPEEIARLAGDADPLVRREALANPACPTEVRDLLTRAAGEGLESDPSGLTGDGIHARAPLSARDLERLAGLGPWGSRLAAAYRALRRSGSAMTRRG